MADMKKLLHAFDEADEILNSKIERTNLSTIVASATASVENKKTVLIRGTGRNIEVLKVGGKTVQDGTPTPDAPVEVKGVGDKTVNLWKYGDISATAATTVFDHEPFTLPAGSYTITMNANASIGLRFFYVDGDDDQSVVVSVTASNPKAQFTLEKPTVTFNCAVSGAGQVKNIQIQKGSTATPYEPYGKYKIPVLCNGETTNIYLDSPLLEGDVIDLVSGKVEKKWGRRIINSAEGFEKGTVNDYGITNFINKAFDINVYYPTSYDNGAYWYCDTFTPNELLIADIKNESYKWAIVSGVPTMYLRFETSRVNSVDALDAYLKANPVTVYFVTTEPTTESFDTSPIPTTSGNNELTIDTEVTPASIDVTSFGDYYSKADVDAIVPRIAILMYIGTGGTNTIKFPRFPTRIISISGMAIDNNYIQSYPCDPKRVDSIKSKYYGGHMGEVSCSLSYDESESSITLTGGVDDGARFNVLGETYIVIYTY